MYSKALMLAGLVAAGGCRPALPFLVVENDSERAVRVTYVEHPAQGVGPPNASTVRLTVGPGLAGAFQPGASCADNAARPDTVARFEPTLDFLSIESATGRTEWRGWDTAAQFERARRWCVLRITEF